MFHVKHERFYFLISYYFLGIYNKCGGCQVMGLTAANDTGFTGGHNIQGLDTLDQIGAIA